MVDEEKLDSFYLLVVVVVVARSDPGPIDSGGAAKP
jgi:hypothetical protein